VKQLVVESVGSGGDTYSSVVRTSGDQSVGGTKNFTGTLQVNGEEVAEKIQDSIRVRDDPAIALGSTEVDETQGDSTNFSKIFDNWVRFSHFDGVRPYSTSETDSFVYDSSTNTVTSSQNTTSLVGFVSPETDKFDNYVFDVILSSNDDDDDQIGIVLAFTIDPDGREHTITTGRSMNSVNRTMDNAPDFWITMNMTEYQMSTSGWPYHVIYQRNDLGGDNWQYSGPTRIRATRNGNDFNVEYYALGDTSSLVGSHTFSLLDHPELDRFRGPKQYGYCVQSQPNGTWETLARPTNIASILDVNDGTLYEYSDASQTFTTTTVNVADLLKPSTIYINSTTDRIFYTDNKSSVKELVVESVGSGGDTDSSVVRTSGDQSVGGTKNFTGSLRVYGASSVAPFRVFGKIVATDIESLETLHVGGESITSKPVSLKRIAGFYHTLIIDGSGRVFSFGRNNYGQLGTGKPTNEDDPNIVQVKGVIENKTIVAVDACEYGSCAIDDDGVLYTWGRNNTGQLGDGSLQDSNVPVSLANVSSFQGKKIVSVAIVRWHTIAVDDEGSVYTWGANGDGRLGNGSTAEIVQSPTKVTGGDISAPIVTVAAYAFNCAAIDINGTVYTWGDNALGGNANGETEGFVTSPKSISDMGDFSGRRIVTVEGSSYHAMAIDEDGRAYAWRSGLNGKLGTGNGDDALVPTLVSNNGALQGKRIVSVGPGQFHSLFLDDEGVAYSVGSGKYFKLGNLSQDDEILPIAITSGNLSNDVIAYIVTGRDYSLLLSKGGSFYTWGRQNYGQLGTGVIDNSVRVQEPSIVHLEGDFRPEPPRALITNNMIVRRDMVVDGDFICGFSSTNTARCTDLFVENDLEVSGNISKNSGSFRIDHPLPEKSATHHLVHSFTESPFADLIYSGIVHLNSGIATVNIDEVSDMTEGTFELLTCNHRRMCSNEGGFSPIKSDLNGNILTIISQDPECNDQIYWQVIGERCDDAIKKASLTDENGRVIVEPLKKK
jgi:alpha-tubulin suppressor-like RCC1 family protein